MAENEFTMPLTAYCKSRLDLGSNAAYRAAKAGEIPGAFQVGSKWLVPWRRTDRALGISFETMQAAE